MTKIRIVITAILAFLTCNIYAQNKYNYIDPYDPEPFKLCLRPMKPPSPQYIYKYIMPNFKNKNETEETFQKRIENNKIQNEIIDKENQKSELINSKFSNYRDDSIKYEKCIAEWKTKLLAWRSRNKNWRKSSIYKDELNSDFENPNTTPQVIKGDKYKVTTQTLNLRIGPGKNYSSIQSLCLYDEVTLIDNDNSDWWYVEYGSIKGYVSGKYLSKINQVDLCLGYEKVLILTGEPLPCENIISDNDYSIDNRLIVYVGNSTDVIVKLMNSSDICVRIAYIRSGETSIMRNIREGFYYLKIAYGKDLRKFMTPDGQCKVLFCKNAIYEKGDDQLDFNKVKKPDETIGDKIYENWEVPSFELSLNIILNKVHNTFKSYEISEEEFNR